MTDKLTRQGVRDLNDPRNGKRETRTGARQAVPRLHGVCEHVWSAVFSLPCATGLRMITADMSASPYTFFDRQQIQLDASHAIHELRSRGWCQGNAADDTGPCCLFVALHRATRRAQPNPHAYRVIDCVASLLPSHRDDLPVYLRIANWNDAPGRTADEVIAVLERVAAGKF